GGDPARRRLGAAPRRRDRGTARLLASAHARPPARLERGVGARARARAPRGGPRPARRAARVPARRRNRRARDRGGARPAPRADDRPPLRPRRPPRAPPPALCQCAVATSEAGPLAFRPDSSVVAMGGLTDSCYMWRQGGALDRARAAEGNRTP